MPSISLPAFGWEPAPHQLRAWNALNPSDPYVKPVDIAVLAWHRRAGKDEIALHNACKKALTRTGDYWHMLPVQEQARKAIWEGVNPRTGRVRWKDAFPDEVIEHVDNQGMKLTLKNGSGWQVLGSDNYNSLVGSSPVGATFSEAALSDPNAFGFIRPILLENRGWSMHISSTRGKNHFYKLFQANRDDPTAFCEQLSAVDTGIFTAMQLAKERRDYISLYGAALGNALFEQEYLSSWDAAIIGAVFGAELKQLKEEGRAYPMVYDPRYPVDTSWDIGVGDTNVILFWQTVGNIERLFDWYASSDTGIESYAELLASKRYFYRNHDGPHDIINKEWGTNGVGRMATAKRFGIHFNRVPKFGKGDSIAAGARLIRRMEINIADRIVEDPMEDCAFILDALEQYHFKFDRERKIMSKEPDHDWTSHYSDALMTRALANEIAPTSHARGGKAPLQGRASEQIEQYDGRRLSSLFPKSNGPRGAWG